MTIADELRAFNAERRQMLTRVDYLPDGREIERVSHITRDKRLPIPYTNRGGDVEPPNDR